MSAIQQLLTEHIDIWTAAEAEKRSGRGRASRSAANVYGIKKLRKLIRELAVRGKLVPQDANDEPASDLISRLHTEKIQLITEGRVKLGKPQPIISSDEKPYDLPIGWKWIRLSDFVLRIISGGTPRKNNPEFWNGDIPWASVKDMNVERFLETTEDCITKAGLDAGSKLASKGDLLICTRMGLGKIAIAAVDVAINQDLKALKLSSLIDIDYFINFYSTLKIIGSGMTVAGIKQDELLGYCIPTPPLEEQHRIVAKIDELMTLCDQLEAQHSDADDAHEQLVSHLLGTLTQSQSAAEFNINWQRIAAHFDTLFTTEASIDALKQTLLQLAVMGKLVAQDSRDESGLELSYRIQRSRIARRKIVTLSEVIDPLRENFLPNSWSWSSIDQISADDPSAITDGPFGANLKTEHYVDQPGYRVIRLQNIGHGEFRNEYLSYIDEARFKKLVRHQVRGGDLIVAGLIDTSIRCCAAPNDIGHAIVKADCYRLSVHPFVFPSYVLHYLNSVTAHEFAAVHHHGLTLTRIGLGNFRSIPIPLPPFAEQRRIVAKVDELMALCDQVRSRITAANQQQKKLADVLVEHAVLGEMAL